MFLHDYFLFGLLEIFLLPDDFEPEDLLLKEDLLFDLKLFLGL